MILALLWGCAKPFPVEMLVVDAVHGEARAGVPVRWNTASADCVREATSDANGRVKAALCLWQPYTVEVGGSEVRALHTGSGVADALPHMVEVFDVATDLALVGGGVEPLDAVVDVRTVRPKGLEAEVPTPAILPVSLPILGPRQALFVPEGVKVEAVPLVPTPKLELDVGGPLQPWHALGVSVGEAGITQVPSASPTVREVPGGALWTELPTGTYALWDRQAGRVPLLQVP